MYNNAAFEAGNDSGNDSEDDSTIYGNDAYTNVDVGVGGDATVVVGTTAVVTMPQDEYAALGAEEPHYDMPQEAYATLEASKTVYSSSA